LPLRLLTLQNPAHHFAQPFILWVSMKAIVPVQINLERRNLQRQGLDSQRVKARQRLAERTWQRPD
jgi:hypothetical protein